MHELSLATALVEQVERVCEAERATAVEAIVFESLAAECIRARHAVWNAKSERVLKKMGMTFIEHIPQGFQKRGHWVAENVLAITADQWREIKAAKNS